MPRPGPLLFAALLGAAFVACRSRPMASAAQCEHLLNRYIDLKLSEDPAAARMSTEDRAHLKGKIAMDVLSDSDVQQVKNQCQTEVTVAEYDCAVKAPTAKAWNDCIE
ncbi:MAG: hypothetical protein ABSE49_09310 [Polyangiaceae bacterium]|jgi:hypothetical protein